MAEIERYEMVGFNCIKYSQFVGWVVIAVLSSSALSTRGIATEPDEIFSLTSAIYANCLAVKNFDAIVREEIIQFPVKPEDREELIWTEKKATSRIIMDYDSSRCLYIRAKRGNRPRKRKTERLQPQPIEHFGLWRPSKTAQAFRLSHPDF